MSDVPTVPAINVSINGVGGKTAATGGGAGRVLLNRAQTHGILGQDAALSNLARLLNPLQTYPWLRSTLALGLIGPPGVGKTSIALWICEAFGVRPPFLISLDGCEFSEDLTGQPAASLHSKLQKALLASLTRAEAAATSRPSSTAQAGVKRIVLFDNFESACPAVRNTLRSLLERATVTRQVNGEKVVLTNTLILLVGNGDEALGQRWKMHDALQSRLADRVMVFAAPTASVAAMVVADRLKRLGRDPAALAQVTSEALARFTPAHGLRDVVHFIDDWHQSELDAAMPAEERQGLVMTKRRRPTLVPEARPTIAAKRRRRQSSKSPPQDQHSDDDKEKSGDDESDETDDDEKTVKRRRRKRLRPAADAKDASHAADASLTKALHDGSQRWAMWMTQGLRETDRPAVEALLHALTHVKPDASIAGNGNRVIDILRQPVAAAALRNAPAAVRRSWLVRDLLYVAFPDHFKRPPRFRGMYSRRLINATVWRRLGYQSERHTGLLVPTSRPRSKDKDDTRPSASRRSSSLIHHRRRHRLHCRNLDLLRPRSSPIHQDPLRCRRSLARQLHRCRSRAQGGAAFSDRRQSARSPP